MKISYYSPLFLLFLLVLIMGCGSGDNSSGITEENLLGYWHSELAPQEEYAEERLALANEFMEGTTSYHFQPGKKVTAQVFGYKTEGSYQLVDGKVKMAFEDNSDMELQIDGAYLLYEQPELSFRFSKGDAPAAAATHPLEKVIKDRLSSSKKDPIHGIWEVRAVNDARGQILYALQELEEGVLLSFHHDGTYTKHMTAQRKVDGTYTRSGSIVSLISELGTTKSFSINKLTNKQLQLKEMDSGIVRAYIALGVE